MWQERRLSGQGVLGGGAQIAPGFDAGELGALEQRVEDGRDLGAAHRLASGKVPLPTTGPLMDLSAALLESGTRGSSRNRHG
jgi:hypothetical protein